MASFLVQILVFLFFSSCATAGGISIDKKSCTRPNPNNPAINYQTVEDILNESFLMAFTAESALKAAANGDPQSTTTRRINLIARTLLATDSSKLTFSTVQGINHS